MKGKKHHNGVSKGRETNFLESGECRFSRREPEIRAEGCGGCRSGCGKPSHSARSSPALPLCQGVVCLERLMCYFYSISTHCTAGKKGPRSISTVKYPARGTALPTTRGVQVCLNLLEWESRAVGAPCLYFLGKPCFVLLPG